MRSKNPKNRSMLSCKDFGGTVCRRPREDVIRAWRRKSTWISGDFRKPALISRLALERQSPCCLQQPSEDRDVSLEEDYAAWERVRLMERLLQVAISEEKYGAAVERRDALVRLRAKLTTREKQLLLHTELLNDGDTEQRLRAIEKIGDYGDGRVCSILVDGLRDPNPLIVRETEKSLWKVFMRSGSEHIDKLVQEGVSKMVEENGLAAACEIFTKVIEMAPSFAEGYNKRAQVYYMLRDYRKSIEDCHKAQLLNPYHFAALSGLGLCYVAIEEPESAIPWLEKAYTMHPGLVQISKYIKVLKRKIRNRRRD